MDNNKLKEIIARQNEQMEQRAINRAHEIIGEIAELQQAKRDADKDIETLRTELRLLTPDQLDETSILGG